MPQYEWGTPDPEGFDALLHEEFVEYRGMIFRKGSLDKSQVDRRLQEKSTQEVQREFNHTHLILCVAEIEIQRQWSHNLEEVWARRIGSEFPDMKVEFSQNDNGQEVIVTFWTI